MRHVTNEDDICEITKLITNHIQTTIHPSIIIVKKYHRNITQHESVIRHNGVELSFKLWFRNTMFKKTEVKTNAGFADRWRAEQLPSKPRPLRQLLCKGGRGRIRR